MSETLEVSRETRTYRSLVTDLGKEKIARAAFFGQTVDIVEAVLSDGGGRYFEPSAAMTELPNIVWRGSIAGSQINAASPNMVDIRVYLDGTVGGFTVRGIGFLDRDGDLIAVGNLPDIEKAVILDGAPATLTILTHLIVTDVEALTFAIDPNVDTVSSGELAAELERHDSDPEAHAEGRVEVHFGTSPPTRRRTLWLCSGDWRPPVTLVVTAQLGDPAEAEQAAVTAEVDRTNYPVLNAAVEQTDGGIVAVIGS